jgi:hypothetical protein
VKTLLAALVLAAAAAADVSPLTNEDVVRWVAAGKPEPEILKEIAARPAAYDVSDEMLSELRLAGVPESVIAAMRARQAESAPPSPPPAERPARGKVRLTIAFAEAKKLTVPKKASEPLAEKFKLPSGGEARAVHDLAVFLACVTPEHVPDQWRTKSPLGRDLEGMPRHEMLLFVTGDTPDGQTPSVTLPPSIEADVDDVEAHDLLLGVAARIGDRWRVLALEKRAKAKIEAGTPPLAAKIAGGGIPFVFRVELGAPQRASDTSLETPASSIVTP